MIRDHGCAGSGTGTVDNSRLRTVGKFMKNNHVFFAIALLLVFGAMLPLASAQTLSATSQWYKSTNGLAVPRYGHSCVAANSYLYCIGGEDGGYGTVQYAQIPSYGGTPYSWTSQATNALSVGTYDQSCVTANNYIYCLGGYISPYAVQYAQIPSSGGPTYQWTAQSTNTLLGEVYASGCVTANDINGNYYIYCMGGYQAEGAITNTVQYAQILPGGGTSAWHTTNSLFIKSSLFGCSAVKGYIYCMGGYQAEGAITNTVQYAQILPGGGTSVWQATNSLVEAEYYHSCTSVGNYLYCMGGGSDDMPVQYAQVLPSGGTTAWSITNPLYRPMGYISCVPANGYLYCMGGMGGDGSISNLVQYAATLTSAATCYPLVLSAGNGGSATTSPANSVGCSAGSYVAGTPIAFTATPNTGYAFTNWSGTFANSLDPLSLTMPSTAVTEGAGFSYCFQLTLSGAGGTTTATPANSVGCSVGNFIAGSAISLTATPNTGYAFTGWTGTSTNSLNQWTFTMPAHGATEAAGFSYCNQFSLSAGNGGGIVSANTANSVGCSPGNYIVGASILLTATANPGYTFSSWTGTSTNSLNPWPFTMPTTAANENALFSSLGTSAWGTSNYLAFAAYEQSCVTYNNYAYCLGGLPNGDAEYGDYIQYAQIPNNGGPTYAWSQQSNELIDGEWLQSCIVASTSNGNYIYCMGGNGAGYGSTVQYAQIPASGGPPTNGTEQIR